MTQEITTTKLFNKCEELIKLSIKLGFYNAADKVRVYQAKSVRTLEEDVDIFINKLE